MEFFAIKYTNKSSGKSYWAGTVGDYGKSWCVVECKGQEETHPIGTTYSKRFPVSEGIDRIMKRLEADMKGGKKFDPQYHPISWDYEIIRFRDEPCNSWEVRSFFRELSGSYRVDLEKKFKHKFFESNEEDLKFYHQYLQENHIKII